jgi:hypothetical protein
MGLYVRNQEKIRSKFTLSASDDVGSRFWNAVCHYIGAMGLLQARRQQGYPQNLHPYRDNRRKVNGGSLLLQ